MEHHAHDVITACNELRSYNVRCSGKTYLMQGRRNRFGRPGGRRTNVSAVAGSMRSVRLVLL